MQVILFIIHSDHVSITKFECKQVEFMPALSSNELKRHLESKDLDLTVAFCMGMYNGFQKWCIIQHLQIDPLAHLDSDEVLIMERLEDDVQYCSIAPGQTPILDAKAFQSRSSEEEDARTERLTALAKKIDGSQYYFDPSAIIQSQAKRDGIVIVFGVSDDLLELRGALHGEYDCFDGGMFYIEPAQKTVARVPISNSTALEAIWSDADTDPDWSYRIDVPHVSFNIFEEEHLYCRGILFYLEDCGRQEVS